MRTRTLFGSDDEALARVQALHTRLHGVDPPGRTGESLTIEQFRTLVETAFWATLKIDEGRPTRARIAIVPKGITASARYALKCPVPYREAEIAKLAPAVPNRGFIVAAVTDEGIQIAGIEPSVLLDPLTGVVVDCWAPGIVRVGLGPYQPYVVFSGQTTVFTEATRAGALAGYLQRILSRPRPQDDIVESQASWWECLALADLAREVMDGGHGGTLLVVPNEDGDWLQSLDPYPFKLARSDASIAQAIRHELQDSHAKGDAFERLLASSLPDEEKAAIMPGMASISWRPQDVSRIASLAAVDGAVVIGQDVRVFGFGAKIKVREQGKIPVSMFRPQPGSQEIIPCDLELTGGTRHQSAVRFVAAHHDAYAIIASQDRRLSVASWNEDHQSVFLMRNCEWWT